MTDYDDAVRKDMKEPIPMHDFGDFFTIAQWQAQRNYHALVPSDGTGHFAYKHGRLRLIDGASDPFRDAMPWWATHVAWFNK